MRSTILYILMLISLAINAQTFRGGEIFRIGNSDVYWAAVKITYFKEYVARQEEDCWCWAACVQMVLNYQSVDVDQEDLVRRAKGYRVNEGGTEYDFSTPSYTTPTTNYQARTEVKIPKDTKIVQIDSDTQLGRQLFGKIGR